MIDPKELRIGNYLHGSHQESEEVLEVAGINKSTDCLIFYTRISDGAKHLNPNRFFSPIPLTEDWLIKFGFLKSTLRVGTNGNVWRITINDTALCLERDFREEFSCHAGIEYTDSPFTNDKNEQYNFAYRIKFAHQLQNHSPNGSIPPLSLNLE